MSHGRLTIVVLLAVAVLQAGAAQSGANRDQLQTDVAGLKGEVKALRDQQRQMLDQLSELKQMLQAGRSTAPPLPKTLVVRGGLFRGNSEARIAIVEYADYECAYCGKHMSETYPQLLESYITTGQVKYFFRDLPLPLHSHAMPAARATRCAGEQDKYWEMHDSLFANQRSLLNPALLDRAVKLGLDSVKFDECLSSTRYLDEIRASMAEAQKLGVSGTPTFFLGIINPDGGTMTVRKVIRGAQPYEAFKTVLDELLAQTEHGQ